MVEEKNKVVNPSAAADEEAHHHVSLKHLDGNGEPQELLMTNKQQQAPKSSERTSLATSSSSSFETNNHRSAAPPPQRSRRRRRSQPTTLGLRVQRVSRHAALATKQQYWDTNNASIDVALSAVDQWEASYNALKQVLIQSVQSAQGLYGAAKTGAQSLEHGLLAPVRDWILLPAFWSAERVASGTTQFLQSDQAHELAHFSLDLASRVPWVGDSVLRPSLVWSVVLLQRSWQIAQYPIPSRSQVRQSVDMALNGTKWVLAHVGREVYLYVKRADANLTRTLSHTQWKVLGSGPYATLDTTTKTEVIDHLCERYLACKTQVARYELAAHIRAHNRPLYQDLVLSGLLKERGGDSTRQDEWLSPSPLYRRTDIMDDDDDCAFLIDANGGKKRLLPSALWFSLPNVNGKPPGRDAPWICFVRRDQESLEQSFLRRLNTQQFDEVAENDDAVPCSNGDTTIADSRKYPTIAKWYEPNLHSDVLVNQKRGAVSFQVCCITCRKPLEATPPLAPPRLGDACAECCKLEMRALPPALSSPDHSLSPPALCMTLRPTMWRFHGLGDAVCRASWFLEGSKSVLLQPFSDEAAAILEDAYLFLQWKQSFQQRREDSNDGPSLLTVEVPCPDGTERLVQFSSTSRATANPKGIGAAVSLFKRRVYRGAWLYKDQEEEKSQGDDETEDSEHAPTKEKVEPSTPSSLLPPAPTNKQQDAVALQDALRQQVLGDSSSILEHDGADLHSTPLTPDRSLRSALVAAGAVVATPPQRQLSSDDNGDVKLDVGSERQIVPYNNETKRSSPSRTPRTINSKNAEDKSSRPVHSLAVPSELLRSKMAKFLNDDLLNMDEGDDDDNKIDHLVLIVHGIGEMMRSIDVFGLSLPAMGSTIIDCCDSLRRHHVQVQKAHSQDLYGMAAAATASDEDTAVAPGASQSLSGRVEYLPVEWHEAFAILSQRRQGGSSQQQMGHHSSSGRNNRRRNRSSAPSVMLSDISLRTIPNMRDFANDTLMDVLYFMSPEHHDMIIDVVTNELNVVVQRFCRMHCCSDRPRISIVGHSLGSIVSWDILSHQEDSSLLPARTDDNGFAGQSSSSSGYLSPLSPISGGPTGGLPRQHMLDQSRPETTSRYPKLGFAVDNLFLLGSPVAVFLMIRNPRQPLSSDFFLNGCQRVYNIFHPYDPVAYRIEPCLDPANAETEPQIIKHHIHGGFRVQYHTRRLWRKLLDTTWKTQQRIVEAFEATMASLGLIDDSDLVALRSTSVVSTLGGRVASAGMMMEDDAANHHQRQHDDDDALSQVSTASTTSSTEDDHSPVACEGRAPEMLHQRNAPNNSFGQLNQGRRIDYMLQEREIETANEYVAALAAHSSYWMEKDLSLFLVRKIHASTREISELESQQAHDNPESWEPLS